MKLLKDETNFTHILTQSRTCQRRLWKLLVDSEKSKSEFRLTQIERTYQLGTCNSLIYNKIHHAAL